MNFTLQRLLTARKAGKQIDAPIVLSLVPNTRFWELYRWPVIETTCRVDNLHMALARLDVLIVHMGANPADLILLCESIIQFEPHHLEVWHMRNQNSAIVIDDHVFSGKEDWNPMIRVELNEIESEIWGQNAPNHLAMVN